MLCCLRLPFHAFLFDLIPIPILMLIPISHSSVFPHTNSQCVQYHNCSYYSLAFDSSVCCSCCWWQMTFHYACGTCADFVITLNKSQILPALAEGGDPI